MRNIKLTLEYDGSRYQGWTRLGTGEGSNTIEQKLKDVLQKMTGEDVELYCGSRTETGVHAYEQTASFKTSCSLKPYEIKNYLNRYLPMDIAILTVEEKPERFHASLNAVSRTYLYRISVGDVPDVFNRKYTYYCFHMPDVKAMQNAGRLFLGKHDFKNFSSARKKKGTEKEILELQIHERDGEIQIRITATDFLHNMARMIACTLLDLGLNKIEKEDIIELLDPSCNRKAGMEYDAKGLFLEKVHYDK